MNELGILEYCTPFYKWKVAVKIVSHYTGGYNYPMVA